jgi:FKBP-type peptidyl-prolyl cis-trans isomerase
MKNTPSRKSGKASRRKFSPLVILISVLLLIGITTAVYFLFIQKKAPNNPVVGDPDMITTATGLKYKDIVVGSGREAKIGDTATVNYTAWLENGTRINSNLDTGVPYEFTLGQKNVIPGYIEGVNGMRVGGKRKLIIPPALAFGETGASQVISPNTTLIFEVELLGVK